MYEPEMKTGTSVQPGPRPSSAPAQRDSGHSIGGANPQSGFAQQQGLKRQQARQRSISTGVNASSQPTAPGANLNNNQNLGRYRANAQKHEQMMQERDRQAASTQTQQAQLAWEKRQLVGDTASPYASPLGTAAAPPPGTSPQQPAVDVAGTAPRPGDPAGGYNNVGRPEAYGAAGTAGMLRAAATAEAKRKRGMENPLGSSTTPVDGGAPPPLMPATVEQSPQADISMPSLIPLQQQDNPLYDDPLGGLF